MNYFVTLFIFRNDKNKVTLILCTFSKFVIIRIEYAGNKGVLHIKQEVFFFFDDSGILHRNEDSGFFVYAGFVFTNRHDLDSAKRKYINANKKLKATLGRKDELKACGLCANHKRALYNSVKEFDSVAVAVKISKVYEHIICDKKSRCRYKDYILKRCIKDKLFEWVSAGTLKRDESIRVNIFIDEQLTATNGYYTLKDSIREELKYGIKNFDYGKKHSNVFDGEVKVDIHYCDSSHNYLIQASDILANRIWSSFKMDNPKLRKKNKHTLLTLP